MLQFTLSHFTLYNLYSTLCTSHFRFLTLHAASLSHNHALPKIQHWLQPGVAILWGFSLCFSAPVPLTYVVAFGFVGCIWFFLRYLTYTEWLSLQWPLFLQTQSARHRFSAALGFAFLSAGYCAELSWWSPSWYGWMPHFWEGEQCRSWTLNLVTQPSSPLRWSWCGIFGSQICGSFTRQVGRASAVRCCLPWEPRSAHGPWSKTIGWPAV